VTKEKLFFVGVKAMISDGSNRLLLLDSGDYHQQHQERHWDFPGGRIDVGEDPHEALKREVHEETGIQDISEPQFYTAAISKHTVKIKDESIVGLVLFVYKLTVPTDSKIVLSEEHAAYEWVDKSKAAKLLENKYPAEFTDLLA
jgi:8-oxo-dGTP pyrophosphatase MutT (NUDIX family)